MSRMRRTYDCNSQKMIIDPQTILKQRRKNPSTNKGNLNTISRIFTKLLSTKRLHPFKN